jgi:hypothetical protein
MESGPSWVTSIRNGEEQLKVQNGGKTFYRRIAGGPDLSKQTACELVIHKAEEDIRKEYPHLTHVPYTVEVLYYDTLKKDCAVTLSMDKKYEDKNTVVSDTAALERMNELKAKDMASDLEVAEMLNLRTEIASRYALTGLTLDEFEKYTKEKVALFQGEGLCSKTFRSQIFSIHGAVEVCWQNNYVKGYCTTKSQQCWIRSPQ